ncbi:MAG TPA: DUF1549 domain-containing protein [Tepidisphaeraceae bacterium]|nr:DUF1549 domain-containing protein [Tepidisphaeraceae bacterium]
MRNFIQYTIACVGIIAALSACPAVSRGAEDEPLPDRKTYIRRLSLDLTGLPPTDEETRAFVGDKSPDAYKKLADRLAGMAQQVHLEQTSPLQLKLHRDANLLNREDNLLAVYASLERKVSAAYLGVGVELPGATLRAQLRLPDGAGLVINYVDPKGPSAKIVHEHDILRKFGDQILVNSDQFIALVRMHKAGESIALALIREAQPITVTVKLGEKQADQLGMVADQAVSKFTVYSLRADGGADNVSVLTRAPAGNFNVTDDYLYTQVRQHRAFVDRQFGPVSFADDKSIAICYLNANGQADRITVLDRPTAHVMFTCPLHGQKDWRNLPQDVQQRLDPWKADVLRLLPQQPPQTQPASK